MKLKYLIVVAFLLFLMNSCKENSQNQDSTPFFDSQVPGLMSPVDITSGGATVILEDYFMDPLMIETIHANGVKAQLSENGMELHLSAAERPIADVELILKNGNPYTLPVIATLIGATSPKIRTLAYSSKQIVLGIEGEFSNMLAMVENQTVPIIKSNDSLYINIAENNKAFGRTSFRFWASNDKHLANDILIPLENGEVVQHASQLNRSDKEAQIMYFPLIDRFNNGNQSNDDPIIDENVLPPANYHGGDIAGITAKLEDGYFASLGINTIWLSPITQNPLEAYQEYIEPQRYFSGYHGYWPISASKVDHRFGTEEDLKTLVKVAHENDVNVILDYICNHVHEEHPMIKNNPDWSTDLILADGSKNLRKFDGETRLTTWFDNFLPSLDFSRQEVIDTQVDSAMFWVKNYGLDGYRQDASKHVPVAFWRALTRKLKEDVVVGQKRLLYQVGETYGSDELIKTYIGSGIFDAQFDFNTFFTARDVICKEDRTIDPILHTLNESFKYYGYHHSMSNITGNHDQSRFTSLAGGGLSFDESDKEAGWNRAVQVGDPIGYQRMQLLQAINMGIPGVPCTYYGDEIGMEGAGDPDSRHMMRFENLKAEEIATKEIVSKLSLLRKNRISLTYGNTEVIKLNDYCAAIIRNYFEETTIIIINISKETQSINLSLPKAIANRKLKATFDTAFTSADGQIQMDIKPVGFEYLVTE